MLDAYPQSSQLQMVLHTHVKVTQAHAIWFNSLLDVQLIQLHACRLAVA